MLIWVCHILLVAFIFISVGFSLVDYPGLIAWLNPNLLSLIHLQIEVLNSFFFWLLHADHTIWPTLLPLANCSHVGSIQAHEDTHGCRASSLRCRADGQYMELRSLDSGGGHLRDVSIGLLRVGLPVTHVLPHSFLFHISCSPDSSSGSDSFLSSLFFWQGWPSLVTFLQ